MRILNFVTSYWNSPEEANRKGEGQCGLTAWFDRTQKLFSPIHSFVACGTWSDPTCSPVLPVIQSGLEYGRPYDHFWTQYAGAAYTAAFAYALNRQDWDLIVTLDTDALFGAVDFDALLRAFMDRAELLLTPDWHGRPGGPFIAWKREGAARWLHERRRANIIEEHAENLPLLIEDEMGEIFKGSWFCPWQQETMRYDYGLPSQLTGDPFQVLEWPFVRLPDPRVIPKYLEVATSRAIPVQQ